MYFIYILSDSVCALLKNRPGCNISAPTHDFAKGEFGTLFQSAQYSTTIDASSIRGWLARLPVSTALFATMSLFGRPPWRL